MSRRKSDRRIQLRVPYRGSVELVSDGRLFGNDNNLRNISEGGVALDAVNVPVSSHLKVFVPLPQRPGGAKRMIMMQGEVVWRDDVMVGIRFVDPPPDNVEVLRQFISEQRLN